MQSDKQLVLVAALATNRAIGLRGAMPWHLPDELQHFKNVTMGKPVIMGRKTWQAIGKPLPGRQNVVVSRNPKYDAPGCLVAGSLDDAVRIGRGNELMVIGGGELYRLALPMAQKMILTIVNCEPSADTWFPTWESSAWEMMYSDHHPVDDRHEYSFEMQNWSRISA